MLTNQPESTIIIFGRGLWRLYELGDVSCDDVKAIGGLAAPGGGAGNFAVTLMG